MRIGQQRAVPALELQHSIACGFRPHLPTPTLARSCGSEWMARQECMRLRLSFLLGRQAYTRARASGTRSVRMRPSPCPSAAAGCCCCWPGGECGAAAVAADSCAERRGALASPCIMPGVAGGLLCVCASGCDGVRGGMRGKRVEVLQACAGQARPSMVLHWVARAGGAEHACSQPCPHALLRQLLLCACACATPEQGMRVRLRVWDGHQGRSARVRGACMHPFKCADVARACMHACECMECACTHTRPHHQLRGWCAGQCGHGNISQWHRQAGCRRGGVGWTHRC